MGEDVAVLPNPRASTVNEYEVSFLRPSTGTRIDAAVEGNHGVSATTAAPDPATTRTESTFVV
jgi:hypothetical protein